MKAIRIHTYGQNDVLRYEDAPDPTPGEGEVLVRVRAAGVNPVDWKIVRGYLAQRVPSQLPLIPGWDLAGEVVARGHAARRFEVGDRVFAYARRPTIQHGTYAELIALPEAYLAPMPASASFAQAAAIPLAALTSWQALLDIAGLKAGERVLIVGASGGTGAFGVQIARRHGAQVFGVASGRNAEHLSALGATALAYDAPDYAAKLAEVQADVIYDCMGGEAILKARAALKPGGRVVAITSPQAPDAYAGVTYLYHFVEPNALQLAQLADMFERGELAVHVQQTYPLEQAAEALAASEALHTRGKLVITL